MKTEKEIRDAIEDCDLMISIEHLKIYNLTRKQAFEWVLSDKLSTDFGIGDGNFE